MTDIDLEVDPAAAALVSPWVARAYGMIPLAATADRVILAVARPDDSEGPALATALTHRMVQVVPADGDAIERAQRRVYGGTTPIVHEPVVPPPPEPAARLGELLVAERVLSLPDLEAALDQQRRHGGRLGDILIGQARIGEDALAHALATQLATVHVDAGRVRPDPEARRLLPEWVAREHHFVPVVVQDHRLYVVADGPLRATTTKEIGRHTSLPVEVLVATRSGVEDLLVRAYADLDVITATVALQRRSPDESAHEVLTGRQRLALVVVLAALVVGAFKDAVATLIVFNIATTFFYMSFSLYKFKMMWDAVGHDFELPVSDEEVAALVDDDLPIYTILVPLYHEANVVNRLVPALARLDYPASKLDVKLIVEEDDVETRTALTGADLPSHIRVLVVPHAEPKTKPKACNYGLLHALGRYVVIYDAEDRPEPDQLKKVLVAFSKADAAVACIQCKLNYFNRTQNLLTRWFTLEYCTWFDLLMPGLDASESPIPLGGTSNHLDRDRLVELGAWDPFNVTEDCDLGLRLHRAGWRTAIVDSTTYEEANSDLHNWVRQRSRWVKGYVQTWLVHMRHPLRLRRQIGTWSWISFQLVVAGTFVGFLLNPIYWFLTTLWVLTHFGIIKTVFPGIIFYPAAVGLYVGNFVFMYVNVAGALRRRYFGLVKYALLSPLYWALMSVGAWKGVIQLVRRPHFWEKTIHGLDVEAAT